MELERRVVLVVQGLFLSGELPDGVKLDDALKAERLVLEEVHFASLPGVNLPSLTVRTADVGAYGLGNHPKRSAAVRTAPQHEYHAHVRQAEADRADVQATEYENIS